MVRGGQVVPVEREGGQVVPVEPAALVVLAGLEVLVEREASVAPGGQVVPAEPAALVVPAGRAVPVEQAASAVPDGLGVPVAQAALVARGVPGALVLIDQLKRRHAAASGSVERRASVAPLAT